MSSEVHCLGDSIFDISSRPDVERYGWHDKDDKEPSELEGWDGTKKEFGTFV